MGGCLPPRLPLGTCSTTVIPTYPPNESSPGLLPLVSRGTLLSWDWFAKRGRARVQGPSHKKTDIRAFTDRERGQSGPAYIWRARTLRYCRFCRIPESSVSLIKRKTRFPFLGGPYGAQLSPALRHVLPRCPCDSCIVHQPRTALSITTAPSGATASESSWVVVASTALVTWQRRAQLCHARLRNAWLCCVWLHRAWL